MAIFRLRFPDSDNLKIDIQFRLVQSETQLRYYFIAHLVDIVNDTYYVFIFQRKRFSDISLRRCGTDHRYSVVLYQKAEDQMTARAKTLRFIEKRGVFSTLRNVELPVE